MMNDEHCQCDTGATVKLYLIQANCGDYYCEGEHVVGVATTLEDALRIKAEAEEVKSGSNNDIQRWESVYILPNQVEANVMMEVVSW